MKLLTRLLFSTLIYAQASVAAPTYIAPVDKDWQVRPIITVGEEAANGYAMVGVPDGLGAYANADGSMTLLMNHDFIHGSLIKSCCHLHWQHDFINEP